MGGSRSGRLARIGGTLALLTFALTGCSTQEVLRFGWPKGVTDEATLMRDMWTGSSIAALVVGAIVWGLIFWACTFHRKKDDTLPRQTAYNLPLEIVYTVVPFVIIGVLFYFTVVVQNQVTSESANPDVTVNVTAFQWNWEFQYPELTEAAGGDPIATIGSSDEIPVLVLPVDETVRFQLFSNDVIHSFWVPEFLFKRDILPGTNFGYVNNFEITARAKGAYVGRCAELCGIYHSQMNFEVRIVSGSDFDSYTQARADGMTNAAALESIGQPGLAQSTAPTSQDRANP